MKTILASSALFLSLGLLASACGEDASEPTGSAAGPGGSSPGGAGGTSAGSGAGGAAAGAGGSGQAGAGAGGTAGGGSGSGGTSAGSGGSDAGSGGSAGAGGASGGGAGGSGGQAGSLKNGSITFGVSGATVVTGLPGPIYSNIASAGFADSTGQGSTPSPCTFEETDGCRVLACDNGSGGSAGAGGASALSAGDITLTGGKISPVVLAFKEIQGSSMKAYQAEPTLPTDQPVLLGGETLEAKAAGGDVPAFSLQIKAPAPLTLSGFPQVPLGGSGELDTSQDFVLTFSGGTAGDLDFYASTSSDTKSLTLLCSTPVTSGKLTVKSALLQGLKAIGTKGTLLVAQNHRKTTNVGDWTITLTATNLLNGTDGKPLTYFAQVDVK